MRERERERENELTTCIHQNICSYKLKIWKRKQSENKTNGPKTPNLIIGVWVFDLKQKAVPNLINIKPTMYPLPLFLHKIIWIEIIKH